MSASRNSDSAAGEEFHARVPRTEPSTTKGHQVGRKVGSDGVPEFSAQTLPAGSASSDRTFQPKPTSEVPDQALNPDVDAADDSAETRTSAADTLSGATSADVHTGYGQPGQGQTSSEIHHDGRHTRTKDGRGLAGVAPSESAELGAANPSEDERQRGLDRDEALPGRGNKGELGAEEQAPVGAEDVAAELK